MGSPRRRPGGAASHGGPAAAESGFAAVLGKPVGHSLSPVLHRAAYEALGLTGWRYEAIECDEAALAGVLAAAPDDLVGYSCTMPLKRRALQIATRRSAEATAIGSANTLLPTPDGWFADNTDWIGIRDALADAAVPAVDEVVLIGAGGTAQAALAALLGADRVTVLLRDPSRATELVAAAGRLDRPVAVRGLFEAGERLSGEAADALARAQLVVSTLPPTGADRLADTARSLGGPGQALLDVVYAPWPTRLAERFGAAGGLVVSGAAMLLFQAARQVELMTGSAAPIPAMRAAILAAEPDSGLAAR